MALRASLALAALGWAAACSDDAGASAVDAGPSADDAATDAPLRDGAPDAPGAQDGDGGSPSGFDGGDAVAPDGAAPSMTPGTREVDVTIAKWLDDHRAAVSLNYDTGGPGNDPLTMQQVLEHGLRMDYELVASTLTPAKEELIRSVMLPAGFGFFGHGAEHVNHDRLTYEEALASAVTSFQSLAGLGIAPVAFAYPGGHGYESETQRAVREAGFLSARGHATKLDPYIAPDDQVAPKNWYYLPDLVMESYDYQQAEARINDTSELVPYLDGALQRTAWIILTYHAIGNLDAFGYYERDDFEADLDEIAARDFWPAPLDAATLYLRERAGAAASVTWRYDDAGVVAQLEVFLEDGLPNDRYVQPLTLRFDVPRAWVGLPLEIQGPDGRLPDQTARHEHALLSFVPRECRYTVRPAATPYPIVDEGDDAGTEDAGEL